MTESEYKIVVKLMIEKLEQCRDEICEKDAEVERLNNNISAMATTLRNSAKATRAEAIKEFAERLKSTFPKDDFLRSTKHISKQIDNLVKEMVGDKE